MSSTTTTLKLLLIGEDKSASKAIKGLGDTTGKTGTSMGKVFSGLAAGFAALGAADFAKDSINAFKDLGSQVMGLQRITGGSVEDVSRLGFAVKEWGVEVEGVSKVDVTFETREAVVTFDDAKTSVQKLTKATTDAGYPSSIKQ